jgi:hypothetical protein
VSHTGLRCDQPKALSLRSSPPPVPCAIMWPSTSTTIAARTRLSWTCQSTPTSRSSACSYKNIIYHTAARPCGDADHHVNPWSRPKGASKKSTRIFMRVRAHASTRIEMDICYCRSTCVRTRSAESVSTTSTPRAATADFVDLDSSTRVHLVVDRPTALYRPLRCRQLGLRHRPQGSPDSAS